MPGNNHIFNLLDKPRVTNDWLSDTDKGYCKDKILTIFVFVSFFCLFCIGFLVIVFFFFVFCHVLTIYSCSKI